MNKDNSSAILEATKEYYDNMQKVYIEAIKQDDKIQYFKDKRREYININNIKIALPEWLTIVLESEDFHNFEIITKEMIKKQRCKNK